LTDHDRYMMKRVRQVAAKYKTRIHTEAFGGMIRLAARCDDALLGPDVHLQHCTGISFEEAMILAKTGTHVCSAPGAGQARGRCPIPELIELGANVVITTDGNSPRTPFDLFQAARKTQMIQQMLVNDSCLLPCGKLLEMITIDAAKALGWDDELGSLESGKKADVIIVNMLQPHLMPEIMPVHRLIQRAVGNDVETSIVDGQIIMENRQVKTIDEKEALLDGHKEIMETIKRAGLEKNIRLAPTFWGHSQGWLDEEPVDYQSLISRP
uniref:amidohydrolase family protein n=1 Tax=Jonquetella anthropi TaxID=428712 RepID=UPI0023F54CB9